YAGDIGVTGPTRLLRLPTLHQVRPGPENRRVLVGLITRGCDRERGYPTRYAAERPYKRSSCWHSNTIHTSTISAELAFRDAPSSYAAVCGERADKSNRVDVGIFAITTITT